MDAENLEQKVREAKTDAKLVMRRVASALEAREKELLDRIEKARMAKLSALKARDEHLRNGIARLTKAAESLSDAIEQSALAGNPLDLLVTKDVASSEVFQIRQSRQNLPPPEENWISFTGSENNVLHAIANLGCIVTNNPGPIGDRRSVRGRSCPDSVSPQVSHQSTFSYHVIPPSDVDYRILDHTSFLKAAILPKQSSAAYGFAESHVTSSTDSTRTSRARIKLPGDGAYWPFWTAARTDPTDQDNRHRRGRRGKPVQTLGRGLRQRG